MNAQKRRRDVYLTGFMGAGKTSAGKLLAQRLGWEFVDLDQLIEQRAHTSIEQIFAQDGEAKFREHETEALRELGKNSNQGNRVIALGGGALTSSENRKLLGSSALIFLDGSVDALLARCHQERDGRVRPLAKDESQFRELHAQRRASYAIAAFRIDTDRRTIEEVVTEIQHQLGLDFSKGAKEEHGA